MLRDAPNLNYLFAGLVVEELVRNGVEWFVVCPGSRSAPLAWAIASHPRAKTVVHHDERGAAFHALGLAKGSGKPAVFVCTSGSAVANALPAVVEASYGGVPMILLTADRPPYLQGTGANQTINQIGIYANFVRSEHNFIVDADNFRAEDVLTAIDRGYADATAMWPGPVHFNCMMDEPLAPEAPKDGAADRAHMLEALGDWWKSESPFAQHPIAESAVDEPRMRQIGEILKDGSRGLIVVGQLTWPDEVDAVHAMAKFFKWPVIADVTAGLSLELDMLLLHTNALHYLPDLFMDRDVVLHVGGPITSRRLLEAVAEIRKGTHFIRVSPAPIRDLRSHHARIRLQMRLRDFASAIQRFMPERAKSPDDFKTARHQAAVMEVLLTELDLSDPVSEPGAARFLFDVSPTCSALFLGNSMPIRDADAYRDFGARAPIVVANRGASGIDGNIATASGVARAMGKPVLALIGDLAALHDLNSLALVRDLKAPFTLVVLSNDGGGIFSLLPIAKHREHFDRFFGTPHGLSFEHAASMYGLSYHRPSTNDELVSMSGKAASESKPCFIEVRTNREENARIHRELDAKIRAALDAVR